MTCVDLPQIINNNVNMTAETVLQEIETLSPKQLESVYSFVCRLKHPSNVKTTENIEPFSDEREALNFVNDYAD
jgi:hypothetical protein